MTFDVCIIGAGPVGLSLAISLRRHGLNCLVVDKEAGPSPYSRALAVHARTLEVLDALGVLQPVLAAGIKQQHLTVYGKSQTLFHFDLTTLDSPCPWVVMCPQSELERCLRERLHELEGTIQWQTELLDFEQQDEQVKVRLQTPEGEKYIQARMMVGCDGAHSRVREQLGVRFDGYDESESYLMADVALASGLDHSGSHVFLLPGGALFALPLPTGWRLVVNHAPTDSIEADILPRLRQRLQEAMGSRVPEIIAVHWQSIFSVRRRLVGRYRLERVMLAGDACHVQNPVGGQGMNTGIADAFNLAWKLALFLQGQSEEALLDSYQQERRLMAEQLLNRIDLLARLSLIRQPLLRRGRDWMLHLADGWPTVGRRLLLQASQLRVNYRHSNIVSFGPEAHMGRWQHFPCPGDRAPDARLQSLMDDHEERVFDWFRQAPIHHLVIQLDGDLGPAAVVTSFALADRCVDFEGWLGMHLVCSRELPPELQDLTQYQLSLWRDMDGEFARRFGPGPRLWLLRPDGHIAYRAPLVDADDLLFFLQRFLQRCQ